MVVNFSKYQWLKTVRTYTKRLKCWWMSAVVFRETPASHVNSQYPKWSVLWLAAATAIARMATSAAKHNSRPRGEPWWFARSPTSTAAASSKGVRTSRQLLRFDWTRARQVPVMLLHDVPRWFHETPSWCDFPNLLRTSESANEVETRTWPFHTSGSLWRPRRDGCCHYFKLSRHNNCHRSGKAIVKVRRRCWIQVGTVLLLKNAGDIINKTWHNILSSNAPIPKPGVTVKLMNKKRISVWRTASLRHIKPQTR